MTELGMPTRDIFIKRGRPDPTFLILLPIHRPPDLLNFAIRSIFCQTEQDFEVHIICDGAPEETVNEATALAQAHKQIASHVFSKGERNGEIYRDPIIRSTQAKYICQISDDDIWFPNHLAEIGRLLQTCDFGHTIQVDALPNFKLYPHFGDISDPATASKMIHERFNIFGPTASGYHQQAYLKLEEGWNAAPPDIWTDLHMWRKFLRNDKITCGSRFSFTNLHIAATSHNHMSLQERKTINEKWWNCVSNPGKLDRLIQGLKKHSIHADGKFPWQMGFWT